MGVPPMFFFGRRHGWDAHATGERFEVCGWGEDVVAHRHQHFDQSGGTGGGKQMADIAFNGTDHAAILRRRSTPPKLSETVEFNCVANGRSGAVAFDEVDIVWIPTSRGVGGTHGAELAVGIGQHEVAADVIGEADAGDHRVDFIPVTQRIGDALEDKNPGSFANDQPIRLAVERRASTGRRQCAQLRKSHLRVKTVRP